jgi:long-chain fatty acid transport protein
MVLASVTMTKRVPAFSAVNTVGPYKVPTYSTNDGSVELKATSTAFNYNFGVLYKPIEELSVGLSFRAETKIDFKGTATFSDMQAAAPYFPGGEGKATLPMPMNIQVGASYEISPTLTVEGDFQFVKWSSYKELTITMPVGPTIALPPPPTSLGTVALQGPSTKTKNWDDGYLGRFGIEYKYNRDLTLRGGVVYDITPQPASKMEPMLPDANRIDPSIGIGYKITDQLSVDFVYMVVLFSEGKSYYTEPGTTPGTTTSFGGTYNSTAHLFGFDVSYSF